MDLEVRRKITHIVIGILLMALIWYVEEAYLRPVFVGLLILGIILSSIQRSYALPIVTPVLELLERKEERKRFPGKALIMLLAGTLLAELFFNEMLIISGLIVVTFGDSAAHLVGRHGRIAIPWDITKHLEGRIAGLVASWLLMVVFWNWTVLGAPHLALFIAAMSGMIVETIPFKKIGLDDNLFIPFVVALLLYVQL